MPPPHTHPPIHEAKTSFTSSTTLHCQRHRSNFPMTNTQVLRQKRKYEKYKKEKTRFEPIKKRTQKKTRATQPNCRDSRNRRRGSIYKCSCPTKVAQEAASTLSDSTELIELQEEQCWTEAKAPMYSTRPTRRLLRGFFTSHVLLPDSTKPAKLQTSCILVFPTLRVLLD